MPKYNLICMSFDGEYQRERVNGDSLEDVWKFSDELGSKWYFYPFHFAVTESFKTIVEAPYPLEFLQGKRVRTVQKYFKAVSKLEENENVGIDEFILSCYRWQDFLPDFIKQL